MLKLEEARCICLVVNGCCTWGVVVGQGGEYHSSTKKSWAAWRELVG